MKIKPVLMFLLVHLFLAFSMGIAGFPFSTLFDGGDPHWLAGTYGLFTQLIVIAFCAVYGILSESKTKHDEQPQVIYPAISTVLFRCVLIFLLGQYCLIMVLSLCGFSLFDTHFSMAHIGYLIGSFSVSLASLTAAATYASQPLDIPGNENDPTLPYQELLRTTCLFGVMAAALPVIFSCFHQGESLSQSGGIFAALTVTILFVLALFYVGFAQSILFPIKKKPDNTATKPTVC